MSKPECLSGCQWFRYGVPYCTCPHKPLDCEREQIAYASTDSIYSERSVAYIQKEIKDLDEGKGIKLNPFEEE